MIRRIYIAVAALTLLAAVTTANRAQAQQAYGRAWGSTYNTTDWDRFYHYPYVYYPQNFWGSEYYRSADSLYYRYPPEMRIPVYNRHWFNYYPSPKPYYKGAHFVLDIFLAAGRLVSKCLLCVIVWGDTRRRAVLRG